MPVNAGPQYFEAEKKYLAAKSREEKIAALEEMIKLLPRHKGAHNVLAQLKKRLSALKKESTKKAAAKPRFMIKKEGAAQICIIGATNSGKSSLLKALTGVDVEIADYPYTTKLPVVGMANVGDVQLQIVEIPSTFDSDFVSLLQTCDEIVVLIDATQNFQKQFDMMRKILRENRLDDKKQVWVLNKSKSFADANMIGISAKEGRNIETLKEKIWSGLGLIRVYTKSPQKPKVIPPIAVAIGSTVKDVAKCIHKDFLRNFSYARVFNNTQFSGRKVGLDFVLHDLDVVEIHTK